MRKLMAALLFGILLSGCGKSSTTPQPTPIADAQEPTVALHLNSGDFSTHQGQASLSGTVTRGASVTVNEQQAITSNGHWEATVNLSEGENTIKVAATKSGYQEKEETITITRHQDAAQRAAEIRAEEEAYKNQAVSIPYKQLHKDAEAFKGKVVTYTGKIFQIQENPEGGVMLVSVDDEEGFWTDHIYVTYTGHVKGAEGDMVTFYGTVEGSKTYETQAGGETYVPEVKARYVVG